MKNNKIVFSILVAVTLLMALCMKYILQMDELLYANLSNQLAEEQVEAFFDFNKKWEWITYLVLPLIMLIKISLITVTLYMGMFFFDIKMTYKKLFSIVTKAEFVFVVVGLVKLFWFMFQDEYTLDDIQYFYPLSALSIVGYEELSPWFIYPFQTLNLFELIYWIILAWLIGKEIHSTTDHALKIVASSYGSALLIWVVGIMFFSLSMN